MEFNSEKIRWNFIQGLRNKEKTQTRFQFLLNSFGNKITKPMETKNPPKYRFSTLGEFIGCNKQITILLKLLRESVSRSDTQQPRKQMCS